MDYEEEKYDIVRKPLSLWQRFWRWLKRMVSPGDNGLESPLSPEQQEIVDDIFRKLIKSFDGDNESLINELCRQANLRGVTDNKDIVDHLSQDRYYAALDKRSSSS